MADIKLKKISELETWSPKELRKLRMVIKNRLSGFSISDKPKPLSENHPLFEMEAGECKELLEKVLRAEKNP
jgi:hypothetical protein